MATYNVLDSIQRGMQFGQGMKANRLTGALSGQLGQAGFDPSTSADFQQLLALDPKRAAAMQGSFSALSNERKGAFFKDIRKIKEFAQAGEMGAAVKLLSDRHNDIKTLGGSTSDTDLLIDALNSGDINRFNSLLDIADRAGVEEGFLARRETDVGGEGFAPQISPVQTDPESGQKYIIKTDRNTGVTERVDVEGALGESQETEEQRLIRRELLKDAAAESKNAFQSLKTVKSSLGTINEAIRAIDKGAKSGAIEKYLPSFTQATIELENAANRMGLDVISATTFGALSEGELKLAMDTAMPRNLQPKELREWLSDRRKAKQKLARELNKMAIELGKGKVTIAEYLEKNATFDAAIDEPEMIDTPQNEFAGFKVVR